MSLRFEDLPQAVEEMRESLNRIERMLAGHQPINKVDKESKPLTVEEAAKLINLSVPTIYALCQKRTIPFNKRGKRLYFFHDELTAWLKAGRRKTLVEIEENIKK